MPLIYLAFAAALAAIWVVENQGGSVPVSSSALGPSSLPGSLIQAAADAIRANIIQPLGLPSTALKYLLAQSSLETNRWQSNVFARTNSLFNRHRGNGKIGVPNSDGFWTGEIFNASPSDPDLRIYSDIGQSARDMAQLLQDPLYSAALSALRQGGANYPQAVAAAGFSATAGYASAIAANVGEFS